MEWKFLGEELHISAAYYKPISPVRCYLWYLIFSYGLSIYHRHVEDDSSW